MVKLDFSKFGNVTLLIAEDNDISQKMFGKIFEINKINYSIVSNGLEVIEALKKGKYDLILMDMQMPFLNGFETTKKIRNGDMTNKDIPIIALTAKGWGEERETAFAAGVDEFIYKPFRIEAILTTIYGLLERKSKIKNKKVKDTDSYDPQYLNEYFGDDEAFKKEMIVEFLRKIPESLNDIMNYLEKDDFISAKKSAHKCKSSVSVLGVAKAFEYLGQIENADNVEDAKKIYSELISYMDHIYGILTKYI